MSGKKGADMTEVSIILSQMVRKESDNSIISDEQKISTTKILTNLGIESPKFKKIEEKQEESKDQQNDSKEGKRRRRSIENTDTQNSIWMETSLVCYVMFFKPICNRAFKIVNVIIIVIAILNINDNVNVMVILNIIILIIVMVIIILCRVFTFRTGNRAPISC